MAIDLKKLNLHKLVKKAITIVTILIILLSMVLGVLTSDFNKIKKFDSDDKSARELISSITSSAKNRYYNTEISINPSNSTANLGDFTFNIGNEKMLITNISIKYKSYKNSDSWMDNNDEMIQKEIIKKSAILRDAVIDTMIGSYDATSTGSRMKREIRKNINKKLSSGEIEEVYFNKFVFQ